MATQRQGWVSDVDSFIRLVEESNRLSLLENVTETVPYTSSVFSNIEQPLASPIPQLAHVIWLGNQSLPHSARYCMERFVELHPGWRLVLWGDVEAEALLVEICASQPKLRPLQTIFSYLTNPGIKSDIVRYFVLLQQGGLYFDVDYEFVRDVDTLLAQSQAGFLCGLSNTIHPEEVNNGILAAVPQHPFVRFLLEQMMSSLSKVMPNPLQLAFMTKPEVQNFLQALHVESAIGIIRHTGPGLLTSSLEAFLKTSLHNVDHNGSLSNARIVVVPREVFHAVPNNVHTHHWLDYLQSKLSLTIIASISPTKPDYTLVCSSPTTTNASPRGTPAELSSAQDYSQLLQHCLTGHSIAIHWWQKSWQPSKV